LNLSDDIDGELREQMRARQRNIKKEQDQIEGRTKEQVDVLARASSLVWICYMRFARRTDVESPFFIVGCMILISLSLSLSFRALKAQELCSQEHVKPTTAHSMFLLHLR
jgi:hypothetical protein